MRVMTPVAVLSVAISVAVIIISLSVLNGFKGQIERRITSVIGDITVSPSALMMYRNSVDGAAANNGLDADMRQRLLDIEGVRAVVQDISVMGVVNTASGAQGVMLRGVDSDQIDMMSDMIVNYDFQDGAVNHVVGDSVSSQSMLANNDNGSKYHLAHRRMIVSDTFAKQSGVGVGDIIEIVLMGDGEQARRVKFKIQGIYDSGIVELDKQMALVRDDDILSLNSRSSDSLPGISGFRIYLDKGFAAQAKDELANYISDQEMVQAMTVRDNFSQIFDWLSMLDLNAILIMVIMIVVAAVNMICAVLVLLLESRRMIGLLRSMGMSVLQIQRIFILRSCSITILGMIIGSLIAFTIIFLQSSYGFIALDAQVYMLSVVPMEILGWEFIMIEVITFVVLTVFMLIPTMVVSRISPDTSMKISE